MLLRVKVGGVVTLIVMQSNLCMCNDGALKWPVVAAFWELDYIPYQVPDCGVSHQIPEGLVLSVYTCTI